MRIWRFQLAQALAFLLLAGSSVQPALAQRGAGQGKGKGQHRGEKLRPQAGQRSERDPRQPGPRGQPGKNLPGEMRGMPGLPPPWMERLQRMTPEEQERFLRNNRRFQNLPPERQEQIRRRLQRWNSLTPEQQRALREREEIWQRLTPEQRRYVREELLPKWQQMRPDRRQAILSRLRVLRDLSEVERATKLDDEEYLRGLSPEERSMLRDLSKLRVGPGSEPPEDNPPL